MGHLVRVVSSVVLINLLINSLLFLSELVGVFVVCFDVVLFLHFFHPLLVINVYGL